MSEYQYYEFQAVDRSLTQREMSDLRDYSSRAQITTSSFVNVYNYGDFKGDPDKWLEKYFDAFLYLANWGSRRLMLRVPGKLLDPKDAKPYCVGEGLSCRRKGGNVVLSFRSEDEEGYDWDGGEGWLASLVPIRADLMHRDHRVLYLGWLIAVQAGEIDGDTLEPPAPPGLGDLSAPLDCFADFLRIDGDLIAAAAEHSTGEQAADLSRKEIGVWVSKLPSREKNTLLTRFIGSDEHHLSAELRQRAIREIRGEPKSKLLRRRTAAEILARAEVMREVRRKKEAEKQAREMARRERERAAERERYFESLARKEKGLWAKVDQLIATRQPKRYDGAVSLLQDLHDLAQMQGNELKFSVRMSRLHDDHKRKSTLVAKFRKARLLG